MQPLVKIRNLKKTYIQNKKRVTVLNDINLDIFPGETLGLVGESGCGKSTIARTLLQLTSIDSGEITFQGKPIHTFRGKQKKEFKKQTSLIFQDPFSSLNPRMTAGDIILEPLIIHKSPDHLQTRLFELLDLVGLPRNSFTRYPHEFSGGQKQRIGIARALALNPSFIICDEPISALDVSVQAQIINLLKDLQHEFGLTYLFIAHDLRIVKYLSTRVAVMYFGQIVEEAPVRELYENPKHPYTQALLSAIPIPNPQLEKERQRIVLHGEMPSHGSPPKGCPFASRCPHTTPTCRHVRPTLRQVETDHLTACHLYETTEESKSKQKEILQGC